jgi:uncharacterized membrane protein YkoI
MNVRLFAALLIALFSLSLMTGCAPGNLEAQPTKTNKAAQNPVAALTAQEAEAIVTAHAQVESTQISRLRTELDYDNGVYKYEIAFANGETEYEYKVSADTGEILHAKVEVKPAAQTPATDKLTAEQAQEIALKHAGLTKEQVSGLKATFDYDDGIPEYDIDFYYNGTEYDYDIHAVTGEILRTEKEAEPAPKQPAQQPATTEKLTREQARDIALKHAGLSKSQVSRLQVEYDYDDGRPEYSVEFRYNGWEYDYEIHAQTGKILSRDKEYDD